MASKGNKMRLLLILMLLMSFSVEAGQHRSYKAKAEFKKLHYCPSTGKPKGRCAGYVIDHIKPLACGGADSPSNMEWQTKEAAKLKDKWERKGC